MTTLRAMMRTARRIIVLLGAWALVTLALEGNASAREDIVVSLSPEGFVFLAFNEAPQPVSLVGGTVSLQTEDASCVATPDAPCHYIVNSIRLDLSGFNQGDFRVDSPRVVIDGPVEVRDFGAGLTVPPGTNVETGGFVSIPDDDEDLGYRRSFDPLPEPGATIILDVVERQLTLRGEYAIDFTVEGETIHATASIRASANIPFLNLPPVADAGPDQNLICPQFATLDASGTTDPDNNINRYVWLVNGRSLFGPVQRAFFGEGTTFALLQVFDTYGARDTDTMVVNVVDPAPEFTFVPSDIVSDDCHSISLGQATATSPCGTVTMTNDAPSQFSAGITLVTWTATSPTGKISTAEQLVRIMLADDPTCCPAGAQVRVGGPESDIIDGTSGPDCILGLGGPDTIRGLGGDDLISGGQGEDRLEGGDGNDLISGGPNQDVVLGGSGDDWLTGGDGVDEIFGGDGNDLMSGGAGQDRLVCGAGDDVAHGDGADDILDGGPGNDLLDGGAKNDQCIGGGGIQTILSCELVQ